MNYSTQQRAERILDQVYEFGHVTVKSIAEQMGVSQATVRRDLKALAATGKIELFHGGARLLRDADYSFRAKAMRNMPAKRIIGRLAAELVNDNDQIFVDSGTTCFELACRLKQKRGLRIIVNSARLAVELDRPGLNVIMLGGQYRPDRMDTVGPMAMSALEQLRGYVALIGADGLSPDFGLTAGDIDSAHLYRLAVANARESILLADHAKFAAPSLIKIVEWDAISRVVTDRRPSEEWMAFLAARDIEVNYADQAPPGAQAEPDNNNRVESQE